ncbi:MAG: hypothetical protein CMM61_03855 [Rhodospirillaceae bacterium]|nr:hypothetical protein [Rhodospirillaceae bacterium]
MGAFSGMGGPTTTATVNDGQWHHVAMVYDSTVGTFGTVTLYIDGEAQPETVTALGSAPNIDAGELTIGNAVGHDEGFTGMVDEVRVFGDARTDEELFENHVVPLDPTAEGADLLAYFPLDEFYDDGTHAASPNLGAIGGDVQGGAGYGTASEPTVTPNLTNALVFDGTDDYVDLPDMTSAGSMTEFTMETWVKFDSLPTGTGNIVTLFAEDGAGVEWILKDSGADGSVEMAFSLNGSTTYNATTIDLAGVEGEWIHLALAVGQTGGASPDTTAAAYINGNLADDFSASSFPAATSVTLGPSQIGANEGSNLIDGQMSDFRIWNVNRNGEDIYDNMNRPMTGDEAGLIGHWPMTDGPTGPAGSVVDNSAYGFDGTPMGGIEYTTTGAPIFNTAIQVEAGASYAGEIGAYDPEDDGMTFSLLSGGEPGHGTVTVDSVTGGFRYEADDDYTGIDSFKVQVDDGNGNLVTQTILLNVTDTTDADTLEIGTAGADVLDAFGGDDILDGLGGDDELYAGGGDDVLIGGAGQDTLWGGGGSDQFVYLATTESDTGAGNRDTILNANFDNNSADRDYIYLEYIVADGDEFEFSGVGGTGLLGGILGIVESILDGNILKIDTDGDAFLGLGIDMEIDITGYTGELDASDFVIVTHSTGTDFDDAYTGRMGNDFIAASTTTSMAASAGAVTGGDTITLAGGADGEDKLFLSDVEFELISATMVGNNLEFIYQDILGAGYFHKTTVVNHTTNAMDYLEVEIDELSEGRETYALATSNTAATGEDTLLAGTTGVDILTGNTGDDLLLGNAGNDTLIGGAGDDLLLGGAGDDSYDGGTGDDTVSFFGADNGVIVDLGAGTAGDDGYGGTGDTFTNIENVEGTDFADQLTGDAFSNFLAGNSGADSITGGGGADTLQGGEGADVFIYGSEADSGVGGLLRDVIMDFEAVVTDKLDITGLYGGNTFDFITGYGEFTGSAGMVEARFNNQTKILEIDTDQDMQADVEIEMQNVDGNDLDDTDFVTTP